MAELTERVIDADKSQLLDGDKLVGALIRAGKEWMWSFVPAQRFGFKGTKERAMKKVRHLYRAGVIRQEA